MSSITPLSITAGELFQVAVLGIDFEVVFEGVFFARLLITVPRYPAAEINYNRNYKM